MLKIAGYFEKDIDWINKLNTEELNLLNDNLQEIHQRRMIDAIRNKQELTLDQIQQESVRIAKTRERWDERDQLLKL